MKKKKTIAVISGEIRKKLKKLADKKYHATLRKQFGGKVKVYGVKPADRKKIVDKFYKFFKKTDNVVGTCFLAEWLIKTKTFEETNMGIELLHKCLNRFNMQTFWAIERLIDHMNTGVNTDLLCSKLLIPILKDHPHDASYITQWAESTNKWRRRASAIVLLEQVHRKEDMDAAFKIAKILCGEKNKDVLDKFPDLLLALAKAAPKETKVLMEDKERKIPEEIFERISKKLKRGKKR